MQTTETIVNGVDVKKIEETVESIKAQPELAMFRFKLTNKWIAGGLNRSEIKDFFGAGKEDTTRTKPFIVGNDEPEILLSGDTAPNPVENLLHALAGCLTTSMAYHAAAQGFKIDGIETKFEGDLDLRGFLGLDKNIRNGYENIRVSVKIDGELTEDQKKEIVGLGPKFSPVYDMLTNKVPVQISLSV